MRRRAPRLASWVALAALAGCDLPTGLPVLESLWLQPGPSTVVPSAGFLPGSTAVEPDGSSATVSLARADSSMTLRELCGACVGFDGLTVLKPAFSSTVEVATPLPDDVLGGELVAGELRVELRHTMGFDPLQPGLGNTGSLRLEVLSGGVVVGSLVLDGSTDAFPSGSTLRRTVPLDAAASLEGGALTLRTTLDSPLGAATLIRGNATLSTVALEGEVRLSRLTLSPSDRTAAMTPTLFEVGGIGAAAAKRVTGAVLTVDLSNPFGRPLELELRIEGGGFQPILRSVAVPADASSRASLEFTPEELLLFLGLSSVRLRGDARLSGTEPLSLRPSDALGLQSEWLFTVQAGGS